MALATDSAKPDRPRIRRGWPQRISLTRRILAVNIFALALFAGGFFYLDSFRTRIIDERLNRMTRELALVGAALAPAPADGRDVMIARFARLTGYRIRLFGPGGAKVDDSAMMGVSQPPLADPATQPLSMRLARILDELVDNIVFARVPPPFVEPMPDSGQSWPEAMLAHKARHSASLFRFAPDRTPVLSVAIPFEPSGSVLLATQNARDITETVRAERLRLSLVLAVAIAVSIFLSWFLARTIVLPLRRLARAAIRVRLGRAREVIVPRLPDRRDEIGLLARAVSDMSQALRKRIDATDSFAADVSHELKNPIASLRSALEGMSRIDDPALRGQLMDIANDDVHRLDRLVTDIAEASRIDALLSRTPFQSIDLARLVARLVRARELRGVEKQVHLRFQELPDDPVPPVLGEEQRLVRVIENLLANAISFSPEGSTVSLALWADAENAYLSIEDEGPGVPEEERTIIFHRFHSVRMHEADFGKHSGLGLAIARSIMDAHNGSIAIEDRPDGRTGARFVVRLPLPDEPLERYDVQ